MELNFPEGGTLGVVKWFKVNKEEGESRFFGVAITLSGEEVVFDVGVDELEGKLCNNEPLIIVARDVFCRGSRVKRIKSAGKPWLAVFDAFCQYIFGRDCASFHALVIESLFVVFEKTVFCSKTPPVAQFFKRAGAGEVNSFLSSYLAYSSLLEVQKNGVLGKVFQGVSIVKYIEAGVDPRFFTEEAVVSDIVRMSRRGSGLPRKRIRFLVSHFGDLVPDESLLIWLSKDSELQGSVSINKKEKLLGFVSSIAQGRQESSYEDSASIKQALEVIREKRDPGFIAEHLDYMVFISNVFKKKLGFMEYLESRIHLRKRIDCVILANLVYQFCLGASVDDIVKLIAHKIWVGLCDYGEDFICPDKILSLFPSCVVMRDYAKQTKGSGLHGINTGALSCEAVYWKKQSLHLCRKKLCTVPQSRPNENIGEFYWKYNVYDWMSHYGYACNGGKQDFLIKLAGYLNRVREVVSRMRCRECGQLMAPDINYSRTSVYEFENGRIVQKDMAAAYRVTVFFCKNDWCGSFDDRVYLSHCISHACHSLIDSRDCSTKCDQGRYVCLECGSCCSRHPIGTPPQQSKRLAG